MRRPLNRKPVLKPQDFYLLLALLVRRGEVAPALLAELHKMKRTLQN